MFNAAGMFDYFFFENFKNNLRQKVLPRFREFLTQILTKIKRLPPPSKNKNKKTVFFVFFWRGMVLTMKFDNFDADRNVLFASESVTKRFLKLESDAMARKLKTIFGFQN